MSRVVAARQGAAPQLADIAIAKKITERFVRRKMGRSAYLWRTYGDAAHRSHPTGLDRLMI